MKNKENEKYVKLGITGVAILAAGMLCAVLLFRSAIIGKALRTIAKILAPFVYGAVTAYLLMPLCSRLEKLFGLLLRGRRDPLAGTLAILCSMLIALVLVLAMVLLVIPQLVKSISSLVDTLPGQIAAAQARIQPLIDNPPEWLSWVKEYSKGIVARVTTWARTDLPARAQALLLGAVAQVASLFTALSNLMLGAIVAIYLLARRKQLKAQGKLLLRGAFRESWVDWIESELRFADRMFNGFFMGKLLDSAIVGVLCFIGCLIMGFSSPALIAVIVGVTNLIPFFGPYMGAIPCALLLLLENPMHCLMFIIFIVVLQQLDGNLIGPRILGNTTGLSGMWVMFAILLFGGLWGIGGMIVGVPLMAVIYDVIRQLTFSGVRRHGKADMIDTYNAEYHPKPVPAAPEKKPKATKKQA